MSTIFFLLLWGHVYNNHRLHPIEFNVTVSGTIEDYKTEADGDKHTFLKLDIQYTYMLNKVNLTKQRGDLIVEPMCVSKVTQADAVKVCKHFKQNFPALQRGKHVCITGDYVLDVQHGHNEIHPVTSIVECK